MQYTKILAVATLFMSSAFAAPLDVEARDCATTCGSVCYSSNAISSAQEAGYDLYNSYEKVHDYPHEYHDYEGFEFSVSGPYYEFPILSSGEIYEGGSPGADRVIFNGDDELAGVITHNGASGDDFVACY
ncbi:Guanine-specific ribonuclease N1/T1 [Penicillium italicum]|uniref:ribonuclease T1 n=1 Tax=Penicillium italicum TaxID=40296 RepID=A0A0A2LBC9_PENIT|nr:Guanine-specific ribonuclease N1/T1 [Penicillium italicum]